MSDSENSNPTPIESSAPLTEPSTPQLSPRRVSAQETEAALEMLHGFREGVREGTFKGKYLVHIAQGLMFLDDMVRKSQSDLNRVRIEEENMKKQAKDAIKAAGGKINMGVQGAGTETNPA